MAKYLGIPLTVSNGNRIPLTAQPEIFSNNTFEGTPIVNGDNSDLAPNWRLRSTAGTSSTFTSDGVSFIWTGGNSTYLRAANGATNLAIFEIGKAYELTYTINESSEDNNLRIENGTSLIQLTTKLGKNTKKFIAKQNNFTLIRNSSVLSGSVEVQSIYLKEIAATEAPTYGSPELVENGDFPSGITGWFADNSNLSYSNNSLNIEIASDGFGGAYQAITTEVGKKYNFEATFSNLQGNVNNLFLYAGTSTSTATNLLNKQVIPLASTVSATFVAATTTTYVYVGLSFDATESVEVDNVSVKEVLYVETSDLVNKPYTESFNLGDNWSADDSSLYFEGNGSSPRYAASKVNLEFGKTYRVKFDILNKTLGGTVNAGLSNTGYFSGVPASERVTTSTGNTSFDFIAVLEDVVGKEDEIRFVGQNVDTFTIVNFSVTEVQYNYLQVADGGFTKSVKEGDVIFNTSTSTEGVVKEVLDNNVLLMSNDNFSTADEFFNVFAANGDTRGNQIIRTDNYIMSEYDEDPSNPQESSFWYAGGVDADKVTLTHLVPATNTFFVADLIESYTERLNNQSATASRLDIPLDAFRDHKNNEVLATTSITLS